MLHLARTTPEVGKRYTDSGQLHDDKGLKHRPDDEIRPVPIPPELVAILRWHIAEFGVAPDGRLFRQPNGRIVGSSTCSQVWQAGAGLRVHPRAGEFAAWRPGRTTYGMRRCRYGSMLAYPRRP